MLIEISQKVFTKGVIDNGLAMVQMVTWRQMVTLYVCVCVGVGVGDGINVGVGVGVGGGVTQS